jgi:adenine-specific DNA-methyltransferase
MFCGRTAKGAACRPQAGHSPVPPPRSGDRQHGRLGRPLAEPARVVDPGTGSARFLVAAGRAWPGAELHGVETDPLAALAGRATLAAAGLAGRARITLADYRALRLPPAAGPTLFLGNPPYVRHHQISRHWKEWLRATAARLGVPASGLAGLHAHFFLATAVHARPGDLGVLVTSAEWLDTRYGELARALLLGPLGGEAVSVVAPAAAVFPGTAVTCFCPGTRPRGCGCGSCPGRLTSVSVRPG